MSLENNKNAIRVIMTARDTSDRLSIKDNIAFQDDIYGVENNVINIYDDIEYQEIIGFGGAFTEASSTTLDKLSKSKRDEVLNAYFNPITGLGYTLCRTHINSCDFSLENYSYDDVDGDVELKNFNIERDKRSLIPFIRDAKNVEGSEFKIFASPWSPPAWMKTNNMMNCGGKLKCEYYETWAKYFAKYIKSYKEEGINIWGITVQNEPKAIQKWDSCVYTAEEEKDFVKNYLGPTLLKEGLGDVKIMIWDHNKERIYDRAKVAFYDTDASKYIWGVACHWYSGDHFESLSIIHDKFPDKHLIHTEGCVSENIQSGSWENGEKYGHDIIGDLNNWVSGWTDWNMILNENGGPNHVGNYCDAPIIADTKNNTLIYKSSYYYLGHFSKYIRPGYKRIGFSKFTDKLEVTAFKSSDGNFTVVVLNRQDYEISFNLRTKYGIANIISPSHSIMTLIY
ncbi:glucosylceramidase [Thermohydrogenium kirishiense]|nr:glucosylceramidase [Thermohydrogenium kirishiense]